MNVYHVHDATAAVQLYSAQGGQGCAFCAQNHNMETKKREDPAAEKLKFVQTVISKFKILKFHVCGAITVTSAH